MKAIEDGWNEITDELGRDEQLPPTSRPSAPSERDARIVPAAAARRPRGAGHRQAPAEPSPPHRPGSAALADWLDRHSGRLFVLPAVLLILAFSIFPLIISAWLALSRFKLAAGGYEFASSGSSISASCCSVRSSIISSAPSCQDIGPRLGRHRHRARPHRLRGLSRYARSGRVTVLGVLGRIIAFSLFGALVWLLASTIGRGGQLGSLGTTLFYVVCGLAVQFTDRHRPRLAVRAEDPRAQLLPGRLLHPADGDPGRHRLHVPHAGRHDRRPVRAAVADIRAPAISNGRPTSGRPASSSCSARAGSGFPLSSSSCLRPSRASRATRSRPPNSTAPSAFQIFRDITWPSVAPVAATVVLIRMIEAFKIVDLPNVLTNGGPGISTESLTLHSFMQWRALDLGASAAVAYSLLFVSRSSASPSSISSVEPAQEDHASRACSSRSKLGEMAPGDQAGRLRPAWPVDG